MTDSLSLAFAVLIIICLGVSHFGFILLGALCVSWTWTSVYIPRLGKFSGIISSNILFFSPLNIVYSDYFKHIEEGGT